MVYRTRFALFLILLFLPFAAHAACPDIVPITRTPTIGSPFAAGNRGVTTLDKQTSDNVRITGGCIDVPLALPRSLSAYGAKCDYDSTTGSGTDDTDAIQRAINENEFSGTLPTGVKTKLIIPGLCLTGPLTITGQITLEGYGPNHSALVAKSGTSSKLLGIQMSGAVPDPVGYVVLSNFRITSRDGRGQHATYPNAHGIGFTAGDYNPWVVSRNLTITNMPGNGINAASTQGAMMGNKVYSVGNGGYGISSNSDNDFAFTDSQFGTNLLDGILLSGDSFFRCNNCDTYFNGGQGIAALNSYFLWQGGEINGNNLAGVYISGPPDEGTSGKTSSIIGTRIGDNSTASPGTNADIEFHGGTSSSRVILNNVNFTAPRPVDGTRTSAYNISWTGSSTRVLCNPCDFAGNSPATTGIVNTLANLAVLSPTSAGMVGFGAWPFPMVLAKDGADHACTADGNEHNLYAITVPANAMGANGRIHLDHSWVTTNNANSKQQIVRVSTVSGDTSGGTVLYPGADTTNGDGKLTLDIIAQNSVTAQAAIQNSTYGYGNTGWQGSTIDTRNAWYINMNCISVNGSGDTNTLRGLYATLLN